MISYILYFFLNIFIELCVYWLLKYKKIVTILGIVAVNGLTHPILMLALNEVYKYGKFIVLLTLLLEILVVIAEWKLLEFMFKIKSLKLLQLSIAMNVTSYVIGLFI